MKSIYILVICALVSLTCPKFSAASNCEEVLWENDFDSNYWKQEQEKYKHRAKEVSYNNRVLMGSTWIGSMVLQAQARNPVDFDSKYLIESSLPARKYKSLFLNELVIETKDGALIDTLEIIPKGFARIPLEKKKYIIRFIGNGDLFEMLAETSAQIALDLKVGVVSFNYRNVGKSEKQPNSFYDLVLDGISQADRLFHLGISPENIIIEGHSLGGAVGTYVASYLHSQGKKVKLFNDRSFGRLDHTTKHLVNSVCRAQGYSIIAATGGALSGFTICNSSWNMTPEREILKIAHNFVRVACSEQDEVISYNSSMAASLVKSPSNFEVMNFSVAIPSGAHNQDRRMLISDNNQNLTLRDYFYEFVSL